MKKTEYNRHIALGIATFAMLFAVDLPAYGFISGNIWQGQINLGGGGAQAAGGIAQALCNIVEWFTGGVGQAIASLAVIFLGISAFFGKVTWGTALMFAVGIFAIFGSSDIVKAIISGTSGGVDINIFSGQFSAGSHCGGFN